MLFQQMLKSSNALSDFAYGAVSLSYSSLLAHPSGSLGNDFARMLRSSTDSILERELHPALLLLIFPTFQKVEFQNNIYFVLLGNGKIESEVLLSCWGSWIFCPQHRTQFKEAFELGRGLNKFSRWDLRHLLKEPTSVIKAMIIKESVGESEAPFIW